MAKRKFNSEIDLKFNQLLNTRAENFTALDTLDIPETGTFGFYAGQLYVWDGKNWQTWGMLDNYSTENITVSVPVDDDTVLSIESGSLDSYLANVEYSKGYTDNSAATLGSLCAIGGEATGAINWEAINGRRFVFTARNGSWFNITDSYTTAVDNAKPINTLTEGDISNIVKAEFVYRHSTNEWILVSFEKQNLDVHYTISATAKLLSNNLSGFVVLPRKGKYDVNMFVAVAEFDASMAVPVATRQPQTLIIEGEPVHISGNLNPPVTFPEITWFNHSLQGSLTIETTTSDFLIYNVLLPNGIYNQLLSGYIDVKYIG